MTLLNKKSFRVFFVANPKKNNKTEFEHEYIKLTYLGSKNVNVTDWKIKDNTKSHFNRHTFYFPKLIKNKTFAIQKNDVLYIHNNSEKNSNAYIKEHKEYREFHFFTKYNMDILNNDTESLSLYTQNNRTIFKNIPSEE